MHDDKEMVLGFLGLGIVGSGALNIINKNAGEIRERMGRGVKVKSVLVRDVNKPRQADTNGIIITSDPSAVLDDPEIDVIVELIGNVHPAMDYILKAFENGKHVVSANKELIAKHGIDLFEAATSKGRDFFFEGSVAGGIPIIRSLLECLTANKIQKIMGIINGTTNYILTRMTRDGRDFADALAEAQAKGYAEADPTADVDGYDAAYKLSIMSSIAFGTHIDVAKVYREGIRKISALDIEYARDLGYSVKLLAIAQEIEGKGIELRVHPTLISTSHPLASVQDVFNAIHIKGNAVGDLMFYGRGAGDYPTGSSVIADVIDIGRNIGFCSTGRIGCTFASQKPMIDIKEITCQYYLRFAVQDKPGVLAEISKVFGDHGVSIASVIQKDRGQELVPLVFVTHAVQEANLMAAVNIIRNIGGVGEVANIIRVENGQGH